MRFLLLFFVLLHCLPSIAQQSGAVSDVEFITSDIDLFWKAFDAFKKDTAQNPFEGYLKEGTQAVREFVTHYYDSQPAMSMKKSVASKITYYEQVRPFTYRMHDYKRVVLNYFQEFRRIYPAAEFPPVYFVIGKFERGGTAIQSGIIIGMEKFCDSTITLSKTMIRLDILPKVIAKCLVFYNQKPAHTGYTLLRESIIAGSADFISSLVVGDKRNKIFERENYQYGELYEETLVKEFLRQRTESDMSGWFYYGNSEGRPPNLGHWIGYKITEAYYNNIPDKLKAVDQILKINDFEKFLLLSGYAEPFRN